MTLNTSVKSSVPIIFSIMVLSACGDGGDADNTATVNNAPTSIELELETESESESANSATTASNPIVSKSKASNEQGTEDEEVNNADARADDNALAAVNVDNEISLARSSCGLSEVSADLELAKVAIQHANYINYVFANSTPTSFNPHVENKISDIADVTGNSNPFFSADSFTKRLAKANYANTSNGVAENIASTLYFNSLGNLVAPDIAATAMTKSLLAAPYHLRALMLPNSNLIGTGISAYKPFNREASKYQGYVLVTHAAATPAAKNNSVKGIFTYPCQDVSATVTALYNESPSPVKGTGRDLRTDPIGQPIYINMPSAQTIKVSNVKFYDVQRKTKVEVALLDFYQDPYKGTNYQLAANEAFILPLTDNLKSCEQGSNKGGNCGLYGNSNYQVSFDVLVDNKTLITKDFTFSTGEVSY